MRLKVRWRFLAGLLLVTLALGASVSGVQANAWEDIAPGIAYQEFRLPGPNRAFVARMDIDNPNVTIESSIAQGKLVDGRETVSDMAARYDQAINTWQAAGETANASNSWGARNQVVVAINGSFFDLETGLPSGGMIQSGWYIKRFGHLGGGSGVAWGRDRSIFVGGCIANERDDLMLTNLYNGETFPIHGINTGRRRNNIILYTHHYDRDSHSGNGETELLIELTDPLGVQPYPDRILGIVRKISFEEYSIPIPFDHIVLSAYGKITEEMKDKLRIGDVVGISLEITHLSKDCKYPNPTDWTDTYTTIGDSFHFLKDGEIKSFDDLGATQRHPRTAVCFNEDYIYFAVVDGRRSGYSVGMTTDELGVFCRDTLDADWGVNQDGGGSSTMWVNGDVVNRPSDGSERAVANGLMMVVVEPMERSTRFRSGDEVVVEQATNLYLGPGTNYQAITSVPEDEHGTVMPHINGLNGVLAKGAYWWKVEFNGQMGWTDESALSQLPE
jgi:exopolysaccharide biosynthesis protein